MDEAERVESYRESEKHARHAENTLNAAVGEATGHARVLATLAGVHALLALREELRLVRFELEHSRGE